MNSNLYDVKVEIERRFASGDIPERDNYVLLFMFRGFELILSFPTSREELHEVNPWVVGWSFSVY
ncbi:MAG: hypothetical protein ACE5D1_04560, partial [Fidelibacterota bacterium]